jgi:hypothetical protein
MRITTEAAAPLPTHPEAEGHHTCRECPICGTEECRVMSDLGMYCDTAQAAHEARAAEAAPARKPPPSKRHPRR